MLTLDYVDVTAGGETQKNLYYNRANRMVWQKNGLPQNPWDSAVQYKDELISKTFPPDSGFEVTYRFTIDGSVPKPLYIVVERPDLYTITCNAMPVTADKDSWWLDKAFGKMDITAAAKQGENSVTLKAQPFTMFHEIAAAFVLGEFSLRPAAAGFVIVPPQPPSLAKGVAHATDIEGVAWLTSGIGFQRDPAAKEGNDGAPSVAFDLGRPVDLAAIEVWNYNEAAAMRSGRQEDGDQGLRHTGWSRRMVDAAGHVRARPRTGWADRNEDRLRGETARGRQERALCQVHDPGEPQTASISRRPTAARETPSSGWVKCDSMPPTRMGRRPDRGREDPIRVQ